MGAMDQRRHDAPTPKGLQFLGAVAGGLVHEIRNPLSTMNVTLQLRHEVWPQLLDVTLCSVKQLALDRLPWR